MDGKACLFCRHYAGLFHCTYHDKSSDPTDTCGVFEPEQDDEDQLNTPGGN